MEDRTARSKIVSAVGSVNAVDGVLPQVAFLRGFLHGFIAELLEFELIHAARRFEVEADRSRVLANRKRFRLGQPDVLSDQLQGKVGLGSGGFQFALKLNDAFDIGWQKRRSTSNEFKNVLTEKFAVHTRSDTRSNRPVYQMIVRM